MYTHNKHKIYWSGVGYVERTTRHTTTIAFLTILTLSLASYAVGLQSQLRVHAEETPLLSPVPATETLSIATHSAEPKKTSSVQEKSEHDQIVAYITEVFGKDTPKAMKVLSCENESLNPRAVNKNRNGSIDRGVFQINSVHGRGDKDFSWKENIDFAHELYVSKGNTFYDWTCGRVVKEKTYLSK